MLWFLETWKKFSIRQFLSKRADEDHVLLLKDWQLESSLASPASAQSALELLSLSMLAYLFATVSNPASLQSYCDRLVLLSSLLAGVLVYSLWHLQAWL